jgi:hypothetical protein
MRHHHDDRLLKVEIENMARTVFVDFARVRFFRGFCAFLLFRLTAERSLDLCATLSTTFFRCLARTKGFLRAITRALEGSATLAESRSIVGASDPKSFHQQLLGQCPELQMMNDLSDAAHHRKLTRSNNPPRVVARQNGRAIARRLPGKN